MQPVIQFAREHQIITALIIIAFGWFVIQIKEVFIALFVAFIIMAALRPTVHWLVKYRIPKGIAVAITYTLTFAILLLLILPLIPLFTTQISRLFVTFPDYISRASEILGLRINSEMLNEVATSELGNIGRNAVGITTQIFGGVFSLLTTFVISFYMLLDRDRIVKEATELFPKASRDKVRVTIHHIEEKLGAWVRGQATLSIFIGALTWCALSIIGLPSALPLAVLAGMLEIIPTIGPVIAAIPAVIIALNVSGPTALAVISIYALLQILENNVLVPRIMQKAVGLNPIIVIIGVLAGGKLLGIIGALLAVPFITLMIVLVKAVRNEIPHDTNH